MNSFKSTQAKSPQHIEDEAESAASTASGTEITRFKKSSSDVWIGHAVMDVCSTMYFTYYLLLKCNSKHVFAVVCSCNIFMI